MQQVLFIDRVPPLGVEGEVKKGFIKIEVLVEMAEAVLALLLLIALVLAGITVVVVVCPLFLIGQNL